ncbi:hypothetical protein RAD16_32725 [Bradyrhizobium sp. 18BD]
MLSYDKFNKIPIVRSVMAAIGITDSLTESESYKDLRREVIETNRISNGGVVRAARDYAGVCSSGERLVLVGLMILLDFAAQADEIAKARTGSAGSMTFLFGGGDDDTRAALGACIENAYY